MINCSIIHFTHSLSSISVCFVLRVFMVYFYLASLMWLAGVALSVLVVISKNTTFNKLSKRKWIVFGSLIAWGASGGMP